MMRHLPGEQLLSWIDSVRGHDLEVGLTGYRRPSGMVMSPPS
jgi:hypothetical protein